MWASREVNWVRGSRALMPSYDGSRQMWLCGLSLTTAFRSNIASTSASTRSVASAATSILLDATTALAGRTIVWSTAATSNTTTASSVVTTTSEGVRTWTALFDIDLFSTNLVRVGLNGSFVASRRS